MNSMILITLAVIAGLVFAMAAILWLRTPEPEPKAIPELPAVADPALPELQDQAVARLLRLPHVRKILDGSLFDYYRGARLHVCQCRRLSYPHIELDYGGKMGLLFQSAGALAQYVTVQEAIGALLRSPGPDHAPGISGTQTGAGALPSREER